MPASDSPAIIVARFLKANSYERTLDAFIEEAGLEPDAGTIDKDDLTIERVLEEKKLFDQSLNYEKAGSEGDGQWTVPAPNSPTVVALPEATNILSVSVQPLRIGDGAQALALLATTAGRRLSIIQPDDSFSLLHSLSPQDSPILSWTVIRNGSLSIGASMSGQIILFDNATKSVLSERRDHSKYVVRTTAYEVAATDDTYIATAGWDGKVQLYTESLSAGASLSAPTDTLTLPTNPEDVLFVPAPCADDPDRVVLIVTRRDSTSLHFYQVPSRRQSASMETNRLTFLGSQNLSPHAQAWSAFSCSSVALCPIDPSLVAVATSSIPSLKVIVARLLIPAVAPRSAAASTASPASSALADAATGSDVQPTTQASQARAALAQQETFAAAVLLHVSTQAPQTPYSTPRVVWRPDGSGVWVNGDDGLVRGVERASGKVVAVLRGGHDGAVKVRDIWAGWVQVAGEDGAEGRREEWVVSGGFDKRIVVWRVAEESRR